MVRKSLISVVLSLAMVITMLPAGFARAASGDDADKVPAAGIVPSAEEFTPEGDNVALNATASAEYNNTYGISPEALNDGQLATGNSYTSWNCWGASGSSYPIWVRLDWEIPQQISSMQVLWWAYNDGGVVFPASAYLEYLPEGKTGDTDEDWVKINDVGVEADTSVNGGVDGANNVWNTLEFDTVATTAVRMQIERPEDATGNTGVGISEWKVYGTEDDSKLYAASISGSANLAVDAVETYTASTKPAAMTDEASYEWSVAEGSESIIEIQGAANEKTVSVKALAAGKGTLKVKATVGDVSKEAEYVIRIEGVESIDTYKTSTAAGVAPILPGYVVAQGLTFDEPTASRKTRNNNVELGETFDSKLIPVTWEEVPAASYADDQTGKTFTVKGTASYGGQEYEATAEITVNAPAKIADSNRTVTFENVQLNDSFWLPKQETNALTSLTKAITEIEKPSGGEPNFVNAIKKLNGEEYGSFSGYVFQDSDIYKSIEAISYTLSATKNDEKPEMVEQRRKLQEKVDYWISLIEQVQYADGYIDTHFTLRSRSYDGGGASGTHRWNEFSNHEMYVSGHFLEGAVAYTRYREGIGDPDYRLYVVGKRMADNIVRLFGPDGTRHEVPGHEEIELGLVKFAKLAEEYEGEGAGQKYYDTVKTLIDRRGEDPNLRDSGYYGDTYSQDATPIKEETNAVGHAVRAGYFYAGVTDIAATLPEDNEDRTAYLNSLSTIWDSVTHRRSYITGGVGTTAPGADSEGFGSDYLLPNDQSYCEICAAIAMANWNQRMNLAYEDAKYADVVERDLYNSILVGTNLAGNRFYYSTLLEVDGGNPRSEWFACACCPPNLMRTVASLSGYMYTVHKDNVFVNMYVGSEGNITVDGTNVAIKQETNYPWDGVVTMTVNPESPKEFTMKIRVPGWVDEQENKTVAIDVNGEAVSADKTNGYITITRTWDKGDVINIDIPMEIRRTHADPNVEADRGRIAIERGPIVYCMEKAGNAQLNPEIEDFDPLNFIIPEDAELKANYNEGLLNGVVEINGDVEYYNGPFEKPTDAKLQAIPYYAWNNRGDDAEYDPDVIKNNSSKMLIWAYDGFPEYTPPDFDYNEAGTSATVSSDNTAGHENLEGIHTQWEPTSSSMGAGLGWGNWWQESGSEHYVQYSWNTAITTNKMDIYWYDDRGDTRVPATLTVKYLKEGGDPNVESDWLEAEMLEDYTDLQAVNQYNTIDINEITTKAIRLVMTIRSDAHATGIYRWKVYTDSTDSAIQIVEEYIDAIGTVEAVPWSKARIDVARKAYEALGDEQKAQVSNYDVLVKAEEEYAALTGTPGPSEEPTAAPTEEPTAAPTEEPTAAPTEEPTAAPTEEPTAAPTEEPTAAPTEAPTAAPTEAPTAAPAGTPGTTQAPAKEPVTVTKKLTIGVKEKVKTVYKSGDKVTVSNSKVAKVTKKGVIIAKKVGKTVITITDSQGNVTKYKVTVKKAPKSLEVKNPSITLKPKKKAAIKVKLPNKTASYNITYKSANKKVAKVNKKGNVTAVKKGVTTITVTAFNGEKATVKVTVK